MKQFLISNHVSLFIGICEESGVFPSIYIDKEELENAAITFYENKFIMDEDMELSQDEIEEILDIASLATLTKTQMDLVEKGYSSLVVNKYGGFDYILTKKGERFFNESQ